MSDENVENDEAHAHSAHDDYTRRQAVQPLSGLETGVSCARAAPFYAHFWAAGVPVSCNMVARPAAAGRALCHTLHEEDVLESASLP